MEPTVNAASTDAAANSPEQTPDQIAAELIDGLKAQGMDRADLQLIINAMRGLLRREAQSELDSTTKSLTQFIDSI